MGVHKRGLPTVQASKENMHNAEELTVSQRQSKSPSPKHRRLALEFIPQPASSLPCLASLLGLGFGVPLSGELRMAPTWG